ncbi:S8/S53 family peptidase [Flindersiella endophytica]
MSRIRAALRLSSDNYLRQQQLAYLGEREFTVLRETGEALWVSCTDAQLERLGEQGIVAHRIDDSETLELPALTFDPAEGDPEPAPELTAAAEQPYWLVLFAAPPEPHWLDEIVSLGGVAVREIPAQGVVFNLPADVRPALAQLGFVVWSGPYHPAYAVDFNLTTRGQPFTTATLRELQISPAALPSADGGNLLIGLFDDIDPEQFQARITTTGATVQILDRWSIVAQADATQALAIARLPGVASLESYGAPVPGLDRSRVIVAADQVAQAFGGRQFLVDLDGAGEIAGVMDTGLDTGVLATMHVDIRGRVINAGGLLQIDTNGHGTHVTGIIAGNGSGAAAQALPVTTAGVAPAAFVVSQPLTNAIVPQLMIAYRAGARAHNDSWRQGIGPTGNEYTATSSTQLDRVCFAHPDVLVLFCSHNDEEDLQPAGGDGLMDMRALRPEQVAKNILCVGASENVRNNLGHPTGYRTSAFPNAANRWSHASFTAADALPFAMSDQANEIALFSNRGNVTRRLPNGTLAPTGRIAPHLVAPGTNIISMGSSSVPGGAPNRYAFFNGTSQATPHVTGAGLLVRQYYRTFFRLLRRPRLLEEVPSAAAPPPTQFFGLPVACPHADGLLLAWFTPVVPAAAVRLMANRTASTLVPVNANPVQIGTDVGATSSPRVARHGDATLVVHRQKATGVQLRRLKRDLSVEATFGTAGTVAVTNGASTTAKRPPGLLVVGNQAAVTWVEDGPGTLRFRLFNATTGATVGPERNLGAASQLSPHGAIAHDGTRFALAWVDSSTAGHNRLRFQRLDAAGAPIGASTVLVDQATVLREPHLAWDPGRRRYLLAWCDEIGGAGAVIRLRFLDANGVATGNLLTPVSIPAGRTCRRPFVAPHPVQGGVLVWEDDTQDSAAAALFDVYATILDAAGTPLAGIPADPKDPLLRNVLRVSDSPLATSGFAATVAADGTTTVVWQSEDEINSDRRGAYALVITPDGTLQAQADPNTPMIRAGAYVNHILAPYAASPSLEAVSACWAGGQRFVLRKTPQAAGLSVAELVRTSADGVPAPAVVLAGTADVDRHSMLWTGQQLVVVTAPLIGKATVQVLDTQGAPIAGLAPHQTREDAGGAETPELGFVPGANARILVGYQSGLFVSERIRLATLNAATLADVGAADHDLVPPVATGHSLRTARHGWFQYVHEENLVLAAFADQDNAGVHQSRIARSRRNAATGAFTAQAAVQLTAVAGQSTNAAIAPRPVGLTGAAARQRQHLVAFQFRAAAANPWEVWVSRLGRDGAVLANLPAPAPARRDIQVIFPAAPGWQPATEATDPQVVCTFLDEPLASPGANATAAQVANLWSPGFGLAFIGQPSAGGVRTLYFTLLDEHGRRVQIPPPPSAPPGAVATPAPIHAISSATANVRDFTLAWTGRYFWLTWVESEGETLRHCQTAVTRTGSRLAYDAPSAALVRATLLNGATNLAPAASPPNLAGGFGWGRLDLRQSLAPTAPVTFHARDDAVGPGSTLTYDFELPAGTQVLRVMLTWDDPPGATIQHPVTLHVTPPAGPAGQEYRGNQWDPANLGVSGLVAAAAALGPVVDNVEQVVVRTPPAGRWRVEVKGGVFGIAPEFQFPAQAIALVFVGSGREVPFAGFANRHPAVV